MLAGPEATKPGACSSGSIRPSAADRGNRPLAIGEAAAIVRPGIPGGREAVASALFALMASIGVAVPSIGIAVPLINFLGAVGARSAHLG
jgi:hypothetical protein